MGHDLRVTAESQETHFFDLMSLMVVDLPKAPKYSSTSASRCRRRSWQ
jgi:hypothetical protein